MEAAPKHVRYAGAYLRHSWKPRRGLLEIRSVPVGPLFLEAPFLLVGFFCCSLSLSSDCPGYKGIPSDVAGATGKFLEVSGFRGAGVNRPKP